MLIFEKCVDDKLHHASSGLIGRSQPYPSGKHVTRKYRAGQHEISDSARGNHRPRRKIGINSEALIRGHRVYAAGYHGAEVRAIAHVDF